MFTFKDQFDFGFDIKKQNYNIVRLAVITNVLLIFVLVFFCLINLTVKHNYPLAATEALFALFAAAGLLHFKKTEDADRFLIFTTTILFFISISFYLFIEKTLFAAVWLFFFPLIVFLINGLKIGLRFVVIYDLFVILYTALGIGDYTDLVGFLHISVALVIFSYFVYQFEKSRKEAYAKIQEMIHRLETLSHIDELTTLYNRHFLNEKILKDERLKKRPYLFCLSDIDNFKPYNDIYGHQKGDETLTRIAMAKKATMQKEGDSYVIRLGGEEFGAFIFDCDDPRRRVEEYLQSVRDLQIEHEGNRPYGICTVSAGAVYCDDGDLLDFSKIYQLADEALYEAKKSGKNRAVFKTKPGKKEG